MRKFLATRKASSKVGAPQLHEITSIHLRAAVLSRLRDRLGRDVAFAFAYADCQGRSASSAHWAGQAIAGCGTHADGKTDANAEVKTVSPAGGIFLAFADAETKTDEKSAAT